jgi:hypothetical protein
VFFYKSTCAFDEDIYSASLLIFVSVLCGDCGSRMASLVFAAGANDGLCASCTRVALAENLNLPRLAPNYPALPSSKVETLVESSIVSLP